MNPDPEAMRIWHSRLPRRKYALIAAAVLLAMLLFGAVFIIGDRDERDPARPALGVMTTLPLFWGEGDLAEIVQQTDGPASAYRRLEDKYQVQLMDAIDDKTLRSVELLLLAQPRALAAAEFAALDRWVRRGGHVMVMADPALQWESDYPLGDKRRPLFTSMMSPLFTYWGLELLLPIDEGAAAESVRKYGEFNLRTVTPGAWQHRRRRGGGACVISSDGFVAECIIGKGSAILVADADMLNDALWAGSGVRALSGSDDYDNMRWTEANLERLLTHRIGKR